MYRFVSGALLAGAMVLAGAQVASAQSAVGLVARSGATFHVPACPGSQAPGQARCHARIVTDIQGNPLVGVNVGTGLPAGYGPADLQLAYQVSGVSSNATIVIVDAYGYDSAEQDLAVYRSTYNLPPCTTANGCFRKLNQRGVAGSYPNQNTGWAQESALDLDMASAMCPTCKIVLVEADSPTYGNLAAAESTASAVAGVRAISNSYGGGEAGSASYEPAYNHPGVAITVSSGDSGYGVQFPASSPHVTAVGGTSLRRDGSARGFSESAWSGAGSGCSGVYAKPGWQGDPNCNNRTVADVSAIADPNTGVAVYGPARGPKSGWLVFGGTSVAAPLVAGVYAAGSGTITYGSDPYGHTSALFDVTSGSNGSCAGLYLCTAGPAYDGPTGLGTPKGVTAF